MGHPHVVTAATRAQQNPEPSEDVHNVVRFDCRLAHAYDLNMPELIAKVRGAIIDTVNAETEWFSHSSHVHTTGGRGDSDLPLHHETIEWDFS